MINNTIDKDEYLYKLWAFTELITIVSPNEPIFDEINRIFSDLIDNSDQLYIDPQLIDQIFLKDILPILTRIQDPEIIGKLNLEERHKKLIYKIIDQKNIIPLVRLLIDQDPEGFVSRYKKGELKVLGPLISHIKKETGADPKLIREEILHASNPNIPKDS